MIGGGGAFMGKMFGSSLDYIWGQEAIKQRYRASREGLRRQDAANDATLGRAEASAGASGIEVGNDSSMATYLAQMSAEFRRQHEWAREQAGRTRNWAEAGNLVKLSSSMMGGMFQFGEANNWFQDQPQAGTSETA